MQKLVFVGLFHQHKLQTQLIFLTYIEHSGRKLASLKPIHREFPMTQIRISVQSTQMTTTAVTCTEVGVGGVKSPGRQAFCAKISDNALPGRLPRQCAYRIPKLGSSLPILHYKMLLKYFIGLLLQDSLPKVGLGLRLALSRTYDADLRTRTSLISIRNTLPEEKSQETKC